MRRGTLDVGSTGQGMSSTSRPRPYARGHRRHPVQRPEMFDAPLMATKAASWPPVSRALAFADASIRSTTGRIAVGSSFPREMSRRTTGTVASRASSVSISRQKAAIAAGRACLMAAPIKRAPHTALGRGIFDKSLENWDYKGGACSVDVVDQEISQGSASAARCIDARAAYVFRWRRVSSSSSRECRPHSDSSGGRNGR